VQELDAPEGFITSIAFEPNGRAWVTVGDRGVMVWDGAGLAEVSGGGRDVLIPEGQDGEVRTVALDGGLVPWALVIWWDTTGEATEELVRMDDLARFELPLSGGPQSTGRMVANDDGLWIGTAEGLLRFNGMAWRTLRIRDELPLWAANSAAVDEAGNLWMADGFSVVRWNGETARTFSVEELHWFGSPAARFAQTWVAGAPGGPLWAGAGCQASVLRDESWLPVGPPPGAGYCWEGRAVGADGSLWLLDYGESGPRLDRFLGEEATTVPLLPDHDVYALAVASDGTLWAAGSAVSRLTDDGWVTELDGVNATTIAVAADDTVWVGERCWDCPEGGSSNVWHLAEGTWTRVGTQAVIAMAMAGDGTGWTLVEGPDGRTRLWRDAGGGGGFRPFLAIGPYAVLAADDDGGVWAASDGRLLHITP
jgi:hypothetical protein